MKWIVTFHSDKRIETVEATSVAIDGRDPSLANFFQNDDGSKARFVGMVQGFRSIIAEDRMARVRSQAEAEDDLSTDPERDPDHDELYGS